MRALFFVALIVAVSSPAVAATQTTREPVSTFHGLHGLTVVREEVRIDGVPVHGRHVSVLKNAAGEVLSRSGRVPSLIADLERGTLRLQGHHFQKSARPLGEPVWIQLGSTLRAAYREWPSGPRGELVIIDAEHGTVLHRSSTVGHTTVQSRALHEGIADFLGRVAGFDPFSTDLTMNPLLFSDLAYYKAHTAGEVFTTALFECFAGIVDANAGADFEDLRLRMTSYVHGGRALFPEEPTFIEARNALFTYMRAADATDYAACRGGFAKRGLGAGAIGPVRTSTDLNPVVNGFVNADSHLSVMPSLEGPPNARVMNIVIQNTGLEKIEDILVTFEAEIPEAVTLFDGATAFIPSLEPDERRTLSIPLRIDVSLLPIVGPTPPNREFNYTVTASVAGEPEESDVVAERSELVVGSAAIFAFSTESVRVPDGATTVTLTVERTGEGTEAVEVDYIEGGGSAHSGVNFDPLGGTLSWADGDTSSKSITVTNIRRAQSGFDVILLVSLTNPSAAAEIGSPSFIRVEIPGNPNREGGGGSFGGWLLLALLALRGVRVRALRLR